MNVKILRRDIFVLFCVSKVFYYYYYRRRRRFYFYFMIFHFHSKFTIIFTFVQLLVLFFLTIVIAMKKPTWRDLQLDSSNKFQLHKRIFYIFACFMLFFSKTSTFIYLYLEKILENIHQVFTVPSFSLSKVFNINFDIKKKLWNKVAWRHKYTLVKLLNYGYYKRHKATRCDKQEMLWGKIYTQHSDDDEIGGAKDRISCCLHPMLEEKLLKSKNFF